MGVSAGVNTWSVTAGGAGVRRDAGAGMCVHMCKHVYNVGIICVRGAACEPVCARVCVSV